jgi:hypothetical protein
MALRNATIETEKIVVGRKDPLAHRGRQKFYRHCLKNP